MRTQKGVLMQYQNPYLNYPQSYVQNTQPFAQKYEITHVNGRNGAEMFQMAPNSNHLLLDDTAPIVWLVQTDGAGYKSLTPFDISPHKDAPAIDIQSLESRISKLEEILNDKSNNTNNGNNKQYQNSKKPNEHGTNS